MEETGNDRGGVEFHVGQDAGHLDGVGQIGLAGQADLALVDGRGEDVGLFDHLQIVRREVVLGLVQNVGDAKHEKVYRRLSA